MTNARPDRPATAAIALVVLALAGCGEGVDTTYGRSRPPSVNGTGVFAGLFRSRGHEVRTAVRMTDELSEWAEIIVRFAPTPGPPGREEADWYDRWLNSDTGRRLVYVPLDYNAAHEYWTRVLAQIPAGAHPRTRERVDEARRQADGWSSRLPPPAKNPANPDDWFAVETGKPVVVSEKLTGPWAVGVDPVGASLTRHQTLKVESEVVLLAGDGLPLAMTWERFNGSRVLVVASGVFLLNLPLVEPARRPLALRAVDWATAVRGEGAEAGGEGGEAGGEPAGSRGRTMRVAFLEGQNVLGRAATAPSVFALLKLPPFGWVAAQFFALGLAACLARAPRLGRARPGEPSGADRPAAHPEALGVLLARTGQAGEARAILDSYRRWRNGPGGRTAAPP